MENNFVAKHAHKYNKHVVYRDKTKIRPPKKLTASELYDYQQERDSIDSDSHCEEINGRDGFV